MYWQWDAVDWGAHLRSVSVPPTTTAVFFFFFVFLRKAGLPHTTELVIHCCCHQLPPLPTADAKRTDHACFSHLRRPPLLAAPLRILGNLLKQHGRGYSSLCRSNEHLLTQKPPPSHDGERTVWIQFLIKAVKHGRRQTLWAQLCLSVDEGNNATCQAWLIPSHSHKFTAFAQKGFREYSEQKKNDHNN